MSETFLILRRTDRDIITHVRILVFTESTLFYIYIFTQIEFSRQILKIYSNIKFHKIRPVEAEFVPGGQRDRQT